MAPRQTAPALLLALVCCIGGDPTRPAGSRCVGDGDCGEGLHCLYGRCRAECAFDRDCPEGTICSDAGGDPPIRTCTLPPTADPLPLGEICADDAECADGLVCQLREMVDMRVCVEPCSEATPDCDASPPGSGCAVEEGFCIIGCDAITGEPCSEAVHCAFVFGLEGDDVPPIGTHCAYLRGEGLQGEDCDDKSDCEVGHICSLEGSCEALCVLGGPDTCPDETTCTAFTWSADPETFPYGRCTG